MERDHVFEEAEENRLELAVSEQRDLFGESRCRRALELNEPMLDPGREHFEVLDVPGDTDGTRTRIVEREEERSKDVEPLQIGCVHVEASARRTKTGRGRRRPVAEGRGRGSSVGGPAFH